MSGGLESSAFWNWKWRRGRDRSCAGNMRCPFRRSTALICSINVSVILYVFYALFLAPINTRHSHSVSTMRLNPKVAPAPLGVERVAMRYTKEELERVMISQDARRALKPWDLINRLKELGLDLPDGTVTGEKKNAENLAGAPEEMRIAQGDSSWPLSVADDGVQDNVEKREDKLDGGKLRLKGPEIEDGIIPGRPLPDACNAQPHTDLDGAAVTWGLTHPQESAADCCQACLKQARNAKEGELKCNLWVYCPAEEGCYSPDIYEHKQFECWLKQSDNIRVNFQGRYPPEYREAHPTCPQVVPWASGVIG